MSFSTAKTDIATVVQAMVTAHTVYTLKVDMDNRDLVDLSAQVNPFLIIDTVYYGGEQMDLGSAPVIGQYAQLVVTVVAKAGTGTTASSALMDFMVPYFERKQLSKVRLETAEPQKAISKDGWYYQPVLFNFTFYRV